MTGLRYPEPATEDQILVLVKLLLRHRAYTLSNVPKDLWETVFPPMMFEGLSGWTEEQRDTVMLYGLVGVHATAGATTDGFPTFAEIGLIRMDDFGRAVELAKVAMAMTMSAQVIMVPDGKPV